MFHCSWLNNKIALSYVAVDFRLFHVVLGCCRLLSDVFVCFRFCHVAWLLQVVSCCRLCSIGKLGCLRLFKAVLGLSLWVVFFFVFGCAWSLWVVFFLFSVVLGRFGCFKICFIVCTVV